MEKAEILQMFNCKFGKDIEKRCKKLSEEYFELMEVLANAPSDLNPNKCNEFISDFVDELSDVNAVVFHIAGILGFTQDQLLNMAVDKVTGRDKDPNYKRKHPHISK